jgi:hypothetical protein
LPGEIAKEAGAHLAQEVAPLHSNNNRNDEIDRVEGKKKDNNTGPESNSRASITSIAEGLTAAVLISTWGAGNTQRLAGARVVVTLIGKTKTKRHEIHTVRWKIRTGESRKSSSKETKTYGNTGGATGAARLKPFRSLGALNAVSGTW